MYNLPVTIAVKSWISSFCSLVLDMTGLSISIDDPSGKCTSLADVDSVVDSSLVSVLAGTM